MDFTESKLYKEFPRLYPSAYAYGFSYEDVKSLIDKMERGLEANTYFKNKSVREVALKSIIVRLDLKRNEFFEHIEMRKNNPVTDEILRQDCGLFNVKVYKSILE